MASAPPNQPHGVPTTLLVVTKPELLESAPLARITSGTDPRFPTARFDVRVATKLEDFPREITQARDAVSYTHLRAHET